MPQAESSGEVDSITDDEDNSTASGGRAMSRHGNSPALDKQQEQRQTPHTSPLAGQLRASLCLIAQMPWATAGNLT